MQLLPTRFFLLKVIIGLLLLSMLNNLSIAQTDGITLNHRKESILDHLSESAISKLELKVDLKTLFDNRATKEYEKAIADFSFEDGIVWSDTIKVKTRGVFRNKKCDNPPLKIKYPKSVLKKRGLKKRNEYKLVYACKNNKDYQRYVLKEYLVYKMYNILTEKSMRVQLVELTLSDRLNQEETIESIGFLIEHREELIKRLDAVKSDMKCMRPNDLSVSDYTLFQVFQFFIGNTDWLLPTCKNSEIISLKGGPMIPIPYDFDFSGMVNARYAIPQSAFGLTHIQERYFLGHRKKIEDLNPVFYLFKEKKTALLALIDSFEYLSKRDRRNMIRYANTFYKILDRPKIVEEMFIHPMADNMANDY